jgi:uncharacterized protein (DUF433 family)
LPIFALALQRADGWPNIKYRSPAREGHTMISSAIHIQYVLYAAVPCFVGTRVPVKSLFDYLRRGERLDEYQEQYPSVPRPLALKVLEDCHKSLITGRPV